MSALCSAARSATASDIATAMSACRCATSASLLSLHAGRRVSNGRGRGLDLGWRSRSGRGRVGSSRGVRPRVHAGSDLGCTGKRQNEGACAFAHARSP